jgi:hypothetical protein
VLWWRADHLERDADTRSISSNNEDSCEPTVQSGFNTPGNLSDEEKMSLSPLPTNLLYSTGPQHRLQNYMQSSSDSDSCDETHESLKATSSQGYDSDSRSTSTSSHSEEEEEDEDDRYELGFAENKFELCAPGIKMPSLSFLLPSCTPHSHARGHFQTSCYQFADSPLCPSEGCAMPSERIPSDEIDQEDHQVEGTPLPQVRSHPSCMHA